MDKSIGIVSLGQSSSTLGTLGKLNLPPEIRIEYVGALDNVGLEEVNGIIWDSNMEDLPLFTKYDGKSIVLAKNKLIPYLQKAINKVESKVSFTTILCAESFPGVKHNKPYISIDRILINLPNSISYDSTDYSFGVFIPDKNKIVASETRWDLIGESRTVFLKPDSTDEEIREACNLLRQKIKSPKYLILDCAGYGKKEVQILRDEFNGIVICPILFLRNQIIAMFEG